MNDTTTRPRILAVEDDEDMLALLSGIWGDDMEIVAAPTLRDACLALESGSFDVVILDIELPDGNGTQLLEDLRAGALQEHNRHAPVIMLTASRVGDDYETAWELDALAYVRKPVSLPELREAVTRCLNTPSISDIPSQ